MLRTIRLTAAIVCFTLVTLLFLDFTGNIAYMVRMAGKNSIPAGCISLECRCGIIPYHTYKSCSGVFIVRSFVLWEYFRMLFRGYPANVKNWIVSVILRLWNGSCYGVLAVFIIAMIVGLNALAILIAPYSAVWANGLCFVRSGLAVGKQPSGILCRTGRQLCFLWSGRMDKKFFYFGYCRGYSNCTYYIGMA